MVQLVMAVVGGRTRLECLEFSLTEAAIQQQQIKILNAVVSVWNWGKQGLHLRHGYLLGISKEACWVCNC